MMEKYYISTAIAYASGKPHIGNTYEIVLADAIARYKRSRGFDVYFQTGTDEHGEKIEGKAKEAGLSPQEFVDQTSAEIKRIWDIMNTSYDAFIRTTNEEHKKVVQDIFQKLYDQGDIYLDTYEGWYCTPCESFWTETQLVDGCCPDCGRKVSKRSEEAYFFKLSKYQNQLLEYIESHPDFIQPEARKNEMINNFLKPGLQDLCVSRTTFDWGIKVPFNDKHIVYVWIDALSNYITFPGYDIDGGNEHFKKYWPADLHLIGKDIIRFHTIYWPIELMALGVELPKQVFGHPWLLQGGDKMSKSKGNILYADDLVDLFGVDAIRYYLLHEIPFASDGTITYELIMERINSDLANILGNLVNRTISMAKKYFDGKVENKNTLEELDSNLIDSVNHLSEAVDKKMDKLEIGLALDEIFNVLRKCNKYIDDTMPWVLAKEEEKKERLETVLYNLLESIKVCALEITPFLPETGKEILRQIHAVDEVHQFKDDSIYEVNDPSVLFARIDIPKKLEEIQMKDTL
ncbi:MAG: methionine--tRNA ligase [Bacilli bacterium]|nr:methionine--tRNA ligase [Bacilli bacterium]